MRFARSEKEIKKRLSEYLKTKIGEAGLSYTQLAERMRKHGLPEETDKTIKYKLYRASFSASFLVVAAAALGLNCIELRDV